MIGILPNAMRIFKPAAPVQNNLDVFAATPRRGLSFLV